MRSLELLTTDSIYELKSIASARAKLLTDSRGDVKTLEVLCEEFHLTTTQSRFALDETVSLLIPEGSSWTENHDRENSIAIAKALVGITSSRATDERLWATLSLGEYSDYSNARRPVRGDTPSHIETDFRRFRLASTNRDRWRENPISRLWWLNQYCNSIEGVTPEIARDVLFFNADLQGNLLGRPGVSGYRGIVRPLIHYLHTEYVVNAKPYNREHFRRLMKELDFLVGRLEVGAFSTEVAEEWIETVAAKASKD